MEWDDEGLEDEPPSPLLPPDDRLWRHPSEVRATPATAVRGSAAVTETGAPRLVTVVALTSCISVLLTLGVVAVIRPFRDGARSRTVTATPGGGISTVADVAALTLRLRPAVARVVARAEDGSESVGSGVIFRRDGMMLTAEHVVEGASAVEVVLDGGRSVAARVVGADADTDIAVLDLEGDAFATAPLATGRDAMQVGQPAITIGTPQGPSSAGPLVRTTVVSAMGQEVALDGRKFVDMIRTEDGVEPGCDGGAVVDRHGKVIGIVAANMPSVEGPIGLATPIDVARSTAEQLMADGRVRRGWLGIEGRTRPDGGVLVETVLPDSPASAAGIAPGDVIRGIGDAPVTSMSDLVVQLRRAAPGGTTTVVVERDGRRQSRPLTLGERPA